MPWKPIPSSPFIKVVLPKGLASKAALSMYNTMPWKADQPIQKSCAPAKASEWSGTFYLYIIGGLILSPSVFLCICLSCHGFKIFEREVKQGKCHGILIISQHGWLHIFESTNFDKYYLYHPCCSLFWHAFTAVATELYLHLQYIIL